jgi:hypothetical protein
MYKEGTIEYRPARKLLEVKISHVFRMIFVYSKRKDETTIFITDKGYVDFSFDKMAEKGQVYTFPGKVEPSEFSTDEIYLGIIDRMYNEYEYEMKERLENEENNVVAEA